LKPAFAESYDVVVAGGGVAGVAAALSAARQGARTALVEKTILLGGLATSGLINIYLPLCDGRGRQVTFGIAQELLERSARYGPGTIGDWRKGDGAVGKNRYRLVFNPASFVLALDEAVTEAGVELWLDTLICQTFSEGNRLTGLGVATKGGYGRLDARCVVDATGDADVAFLCGAECEEADNWMSLWALNVSVDVARRAAETGSAVPLLHSLRMGAAAHGKDHPFGTRKYRGTNAREITEFVLEGRRLLREHYREAQQADGAEGRNRQFPMTLPTMPQFRTTRRIAGKETLTDGQSARRFETSIGLVADWRRPGPVWEVPFETLVPRSAGGLLAAGRCISASQDAWEIMRVIPAAALTGEAAGLAAAIAAERKLTPADVPVAELQQRLRARGLTLHIDGD